MHTFYLIRMIKEQFRVRSYCTNCVFIGVKYIIIWYNFQACCIAGYRDITPVSEFSYRPSYVSSGEDPFCLGKQCGTCYIIRAAR